MTGNSLQNVIVVLPSLDPDERMPKTVRGMLAAGFSRVLVVNDGSKPENLHFFDEVAEIAGVTVIGYEVNKGKGSALKTAFRWILDNEPDVAGAITVDGDDQHAPDDTARCAEKMLETGHITIGCRDFDDPSVPRRNRFGNKTTIAVFRLLIGMKISDTQTGLRAFPRNRFEWLLTIEGERFEYENNMLLDMNDQKVPFEEVKIKTIYIGGNSTSHFDPIRDSIKVYKPILKRARGFKYLIGSSGSAVIDVASFALINGLLRLAGLTGSVETGASLLGTRDALRIFIATAAARLISSLCNYHWNRKAVFHSKEKKSRTMTRYYILCVCQFFIMSTLVSVLSQLTHATGFGETCLKMLVDLVLFFGSYQIQKHWVFK